MPEEQKGPPEIIYLQWWNEYGLAAEEVTWCEDDIDCNGVKYKRVPEGE